MWYNISIKIAVKMQGVPSNNDYAHMPWFHFDPKKGKEADIGVTKRLSDFVLKYAKEDSDIYNKAEALKDKYKQCEQVLLSGYPDYDPSSACLCGRLRRIREKHPSSRW